jgi:phage repressor protein C with HTH and peptisase S24 domain
LALEAAAGLGKEPVDFPETYFFQVSYSLIRPYRPENIKAVYVSGDSMVFMLFPLGIPL